MHSLNIDPRSTLIIAAGLFLLFSACTWYILSKNITKSLLLWCSSGVIASMGITLIILRDLIHDVLSYHLGNLLIVFFISLWCQALRMELFKPWKHIAIAASLFLFILIYSILYEYTNPYWKDIFTKLTLFFLFFHLFQLSLLVAINEKSVNTFSLAGVSLLISCSFLYQIIILTINPDLATGPFRESKDNILTALSSVLFVAIGYFSYVGRELEKASFNEIKIKIEQTKLLEDIKLQRQLRTMEKNHNMNLVSASLAHELSQPLTAAYTNSQLFKRSLDREDLSINNLLQLTHRISLNIDRASKILDRIRRILSTTAQKFECLNLKELINDNINSLRDNLIPKDTTIIINHDKDDIFIFGDEVLLSQVLTNLFKNAIEAMSSTMHKKLTISIILDDKDVTVLIEDNGFGLTSNNSFDLKKSNLSSSKESGLGVGLYISEDIIKRHNGSLTILTSNTAGTIASIKLPIGNK